MKVRKGDTVLVIAGRDKGAQGKVIAAYPRLGKILVEGVNRVKRHTRPNPIKGQTGGIVDKEMPIQASNVALFNPATGKADRVGFRVLDDGRKVRYFKSNGEVADA